jgi:hypothetical protein
MTLLYEYGYLYLMKRMGMSMKNGKMKIFDMGCGEFY